MVEAAGVELITMLTARKLLIPGSATRAKTAPLPDPLYVYCTKNTFRYGDPLTPYRDTVSHGFAAMEREKTRSFLNCHMNLLERRTLGLGRFPRCRAFCVVIGDMVDPRADGIVPHGPSVARLQHF